MELFRGARRISLKRARTAGVDGGLFSVYTKTKSFQWDRRKAHGNAVKHDVCFEEAALAFDDPYALVLDDLEHSAHEIRQWLIGDSGFSVLVVVFTLRPPGYGVRIISARRAGRREKKGYEESKRV